MTTMGPLNQAGNTQQNPETTTQGFTMTRAAVAIIIMWVAAIGGGIGAGVQWGWGAGLFASCVMIAVYGIFLGIGS